VIVDLLETEPGKRDGMANSMTQVDQRFPATNESPRGAPGRARRGLTLVEVLVATVVLTGVLLIVSTVFTTASNTTGQVIANSELLADFNAMQERLRADLETIEPGMLSIYAPNTYNETCRTSRRCARPIRDSGAAACRGASRGPTCCRSFPAARDTSRTG
jgi:prepilin-type N-terminal cleavage/methylation domain-containing protein